jgi:hypothetical protein
MHPAAAILALAVLLPAAHAAPVADPAEPAGVFGADQRLLSTYFFWRGPWDDVAINAGAPLGMNGTWKTTYPPPGDPRAAIYGLDSAANWPGWKLPDATRWPAIYTQPEQHPLWLMGEWRAMKWTGMDFVLIDDWNSLVFNGDGTPQRAFRDLAEAWNELDRRGEDPLPMTFILESPFAEFQPPPDHDGTQASVDGIDELWKPTWAFLRQFYGEDDYQPILPLRALARVMVNGEARPIVHFWFPTWVDAGLRKWDRWAFDELRRKCREAFGVEPYIGVNQHIHGPQFVGGWNGEQPAGGRADITPAAGVVDYDLPWWCGLLGPQAYSRAIGIGPGHWCPRQTGEEVASKHWDPTEYAPDNTRYEMNWRRVLSDPANFSRKLLIIESWNNSDEACAIDYSEPKDFRRADGTLIDRWGERPEEYMALTRELAPYWKRGEVPERFRGH